MRRLALTPHVAAEDTYLRPRASESIRSLARHSPGWGVFDPPPAKPQTLFFYCKTAIELGVFPTL